MAEMISPATTPPAEKPDWFLSSVQNLIPENFDELNKMGVITSDFELKDRDNYWNDDRIKALYQGQRAAFDTDYNQFAEKYEGFNAAEFYKNNFSGAKTALQEWTGSILPSPHAQRSAPDPWGRYYSSEGLVNGGYSPKQRGWRETAIETGVLVDGNMVPVSDFDGSAKFAKYDTGEFKMHEGRPYLEPVGENEELRQVDEIYNWASEHMGYYGHDYSAIQILGTFPKNLLNFASNTLDSLAEYPKAVNAFFGQDNSEFHQDIISVENWAKSFRISQTERGQESFFSLENITDLAQQVTYQLGSMYLTAGAASAGANALGFLSQSQQIGSVAGRLFMVGIAAGDISDMARENGLTDREAGLLLGLTSAAFYPIMGLSEAVIGRMNPTASRAAMRDFFNKFGGVEVARKGTKSSAKAFITNMKHGIKDWMYKSQKLTFGDKTGILPTASGAALEAVEETSEHVVNMGMRGLYNLFNNNIAEDSWAAGALGTSKENKFEFDWAHEANMLGYSAAGGAMGGAIASRLFRLIGKRNPDLRRQMVQAIQDGKERMFYSYIDHAERNGLLDATWLNEDDEVLQQAGVSKNEASANVLRGMVDWMVEMRDSTGLKDLYKNNAERAAVFNKFFTTLGEEVDLGDGNILKSSSIGVDVSNLHEEIIDLNNEISEKEGMPGVSSEEISLLKDEMKVKQELLQATIKGDNVQQYVAEGLYNLTAIRTSDPDLKLAKLTGKQFMDLNNMYSISTEALEQKYNERTEAIATADAEATLDDTLNVSQKGKDRLINETRVELDKAVLAFDDINKENEEYAPVASFFKEQVTSEDAEAVSQSIADLNDEIGLGSAEGLALSEAANNYARALAIDPVIPPVEPQPTEALMTMIRDNEGSYSPTRTPIKQAIEREQSLPDDTNMNPVIDIMKSINARKAQIKALPAIGDKVNKALALDDKALLPVLTPELSASLSRTLTDYQAQALELFLQRQNNTNNSEAVLNDIALVRLEQEYNVIDKLVETVSGSDVTGLADIIVQYTTPFLEEIENKNVAGAIAVQRQMESAIYDSFWDKKESVFKTIEIPDEVNVSENAINGGSLDPYTELYNYVRRVLNLKADDFWNAYYTTLGNTNPTNFTPSWEQALVVKQAVQSAMGSNYGENWMTPRGDATRYNNSVFVGGDGGTGKSTQVVPLVVGTLNQILGGKSFITSKQDARGQKIKNIREAVVDYFTVNDKKTIPFASLGKNLAEFLSDPEISETNVIVFDEATLLTGQELRNLQSHVDRINNKRIEAGQENLLKVIYTGDLRQNNIDTVVVPGIDTRADGFDSKALHVIDRTSTLQFSFRAQNQGLRLFTDYLKMIQAERGTSEPFVAKYGNGKGVEIVNDRASFNTKAKNIIKKMDQNGELAQVAYITDRDPSLVSSDIVSSGVTILSSEQAQGEQWPVVILDFENGKIFEPDSQNLNVKRSYYTGVTRAKNYVLSYLDPSQGITSSSGTVAQTIPVSPSNDIQQHSNQVKEILGESFNSDVNIHKDVTKSEGGKTPEPSEPVIEDGPDVGNILRQINSKETISLFTFFTTGNTPAKFEVQLDLKRKALYDFPTDASYFLTIARNGSPEYENIVNNDSRFKGQYAMFIEAIIDGQRTIVGTLPGNKGEMHKLIQESIPKGVDNISIKIDPLFMKDPAPLHSGPSVSYASKAEVAANEFISSLPQGITAGSYRIALDPVLNINLEPLANPGDTIIPVSFKYTSKDAIDEAVRDVSLTSTPSGVSWVNLSRGRVPFDDAIAYMNENFYNKELKSYEFSPTGGNVYYSFWSHYATHSPADTGNQAGKPYKNVLADAFKILSNRPGQSKEYRDFLNFYASQKISSEPGKLIEDIIAEKNLKGHDITGGNSSYFLADYMVYLNGDQGDADLSSKRRSFTKELYDQAITDLKQLPDFREGLLFAVRKAPRGEKGESKLPHVPTGQYPDGFIGSYMTTNGKVGMPAPNINKESLIEKISNAVSSGNTTVNESGVSTKPTDIPGDDGSGTEMDDRNESTVQVLQETDSSLVTFYKRWFNLRPELMLKTTNDFKRSLFNEVFDLTMGQIKNVDDAVKSYLKQLDASLPASYTKEDVAEWKKAMAKDASMENLYKASVIRAEFEFLLDQYFPAIKRIDNRYTFKTTNQKQIGFYDNESVSQFDESATEMIRMQVANTPLIKATPTGSFQYLTDSRLNRMYMSKDDLEEIILAVQGANTDEEAIQMLKDTRKTAPLSFYARFLAPGATSIQGEDVLSFASIDNDDAKDIATAMLGFIRSTDIYALSAVVFDGDEASTKGLPISADGRPNIVRDNGYNALDIVAQDLVVGSQPGQVTLKGNVYKEGTAEQPATEKEILELTHALGLTSYQQESIDWLYENFPIKAVDQGKKEEVIRNQIMNDLLIPLATEMGKGNKEGVNVRRKHVQLNNFVFEPIMATNEINNVSRQRSINNTLVERMRKSSPAMKINATVKEVQELGALSVNENNLLADGSYEVVAPFVKEGVRKREGIRTSTRPAIKMTEGETADIDILYNFASTAARTGNTVALPIQVFSDSPTDVTLVVRAKKGVYRDKGAISKDVFESRRSYFTKTERNILDAYNAKFDKDFKNIRQLQNWLNSENISVSSLESSEGFVRGLYYDPKAKPAKLKDELVKEIEFYKQDKLDDFRTQLDSQYQQLVELAKNSVDEKGNNLIERLSGIGGRAGETHLESFFYNWVAVSNAFKEMMVGSRFQYDAKGNPSPESGEFIDEIKRAQAETSSKNLFVHRNESWTAPENAEDMTEAQFREGKKLPRRVKVAYVNDPVDTGIDSSTGNNFEQEIYDGATFVLPLMRYMQAASYGGAFGTGTPPVMKNATAAVDQVTGVKTYIKHAEFLLTEEIIRESYTDDEGFNRVHHMVKQMLNQPLNRTYELDGVEVSTAWETLLVLVNGDKSNEDLSNIAKTTEDERGDTIPGHFEELFDLLVRWGDQDAPIMEIIPASSAKTGRGATTSMDGKYVPEFLDIIHKGTQLDASKEGDTENQIKMLTQTVNAAALNWKEPTQVANLLGTLNTYTNEILNELSNLTQQETDEFKPLLRSWINQGLFQSKSLTYQHLLSHTNPEYGFNDPQIFNTVFTKLNNTLSTGIDNVLAGKKGKNSKIKDSYAAVAPSLRGNHYIVHPFSGLMKLYDVQRGGRTVTVLKSQIGENEAAIPRDLKWNDPWKEVEGERKTLTEMLEGKSKSEQREVLASLQDGTWNPGEAEIVLPADARDEFFLQDALDSNIPIEEIDPEYFAQQITKAYPKRSQSKVAADAVLMYIAFKARMKGLTTRIPSTGKHSAVNTKIAAFMNDSENAVMVPPKLLHVQGADQDIDKGEHITYEVLDGKLPLLNAKGEVMTPAEMAEFYGRPIIKAASGFRNKREAKLAALKNRVVDSLINIMGSPLNTVEANTSVESVLSELRNLAKEKQEARTYSRDDYTSMTKMHADNQAGKALVGVFANGLKAYQVLYAGAKINDASGGSFDNLAGLTGENQIWKKFAGLINAATDNAKEQILGPLGINIDNAGMVSAQVASGWSWDQISDFLTKNDTDLQQLYNSKRYDQAAFDTDIWQESNPDLYNWYMRGEEYGMLARSVMNRNIPNSAHDMWAFRNNIETFVNERIDGELDFIQFIADEDYADDMITQYEDAVGKNDTMGLNILFALKKTPHISGYLQAYRFSYETMENYSVMFRKSNEIASAMPDNIPVTRDVYRDINNFLYGKLVHDFFSENSVVIAGNDLATPAGRTKFVNNMNTEWVNEMANRQGDNMFIKNLITSEDKRLNSKPAKRLKINDTHEMDEEMVMLVKDGFESLSETTQKKLAYYNLIVDKGRVKKGSFSQLFDPGYGIISDFNDFIESKADIQITPGEYLGFGRGRFDNALLHNAIPYTGSGEGSVTIEEKAGTTSTVSNDTNIPAFNTLEALPDRTIDWLNNNFPNEFSIPYNISWATNVEVKGLINRILPLDVALRELRQSKNQILSQDEKRVIDGVLAKVDAIFKAQNIDVEQRMRDCGF